MKLLIITALGVGAATVFGSALGFVFKSAAKRFADIAVGLAAGVMLAAAVLGLILPSLEQGGDYALPVTVAGLVFGALSLGLLEKAVPSLYGVLGVGKESDSVLLFVLAIAVHNIPEGIAAGVGFGNGDVSAALTVAGGIAMQNIPEGAVIIAPMLAAGISVRRTFVTALFTGLVEVVGTFIGYFAVSVASSVLPFALAAAGGTMLYVISDGMITEMHSHGHERAATYALLCGFCLMLAFDFYV